MTDTFRPNFPLDPFPETDPWILKHDVLYSLSETKNFEQVVLILGEPTYPDLFPLLQSHRLSSSLLLIITHCPPKFPYHSIVRPSVCFLRILNPLFEDDSAAISLASVLERATRVVKRWRKSLSPFNSSERCTQLCEDGAAAEFTVSEKFGFNPNSESPAASHSASPKPAAYALSTPPPSRPLSLISMSSKRSSTSLRSERMQDTARTNGFDAIISFISPTLPEKMMFKQCVLVTTLSQTFFTTTSHSFLSSTISSPSVTRPPSLRSSRRRSSILSMFRSADQSDIAISAYSTPATSRSQSPMSFTPSQLKVGAMLPAKHSHLIHVLPHAHPLHNDMKSQLVKSMERFLISYLLSSNYIRGRTNSKPKSVRHTLSFNNTTSVDPSKSESTLRIPDVGLSSTDRPVPYILSAGLLSHVPQTWNDVEEMSVAELLLLGALDGSNSQSSVRDGFLRAIPIIPRACVGGPADICITTADDTDDVGSSDNGVGSQTSLPIRPRLRTRSSRHSKLRLSSAQSDGSNVGDGSADYFIRSNSSQPASDTHVATAQAMKSGGLTTPPDSGSNSSSSEEEEIRPPLSDQGQPESSTESAPSAISPTLTTSKSKGFSVRWKFWKK